MYTYLSSFRYNVDFLSCSKLSLQRHPEQKPHRSIHSAFIHPTWRNDSLREKWRWLSMSHRPIISVYKAVISYSFTILRFSLLLRIHHLQIFQRLHRKEKSVKTHGWNSMSFCYRSCGHPHWPLLWRPAPAFRALWCLAWCDEWQSHEGPVEAFYGFNSISSA